MKQLTEHLIKRYKDIVVTSISCSKRLYYGIASFTPTFTVLSKQHAPRMINSTNKKINDFLHTYFKFALPVSINCPDHVQSPDLIAKSKKLVLETYQNMVRNIQQPFSSLMKTCSNL